MQKNLKVSVVAGVIGVCLIGGVVIFQPKNTPVEENQSTEVIEQTIEEVETTEEPSTEYELTDYDKSHIRFYLQELENGNMTEDDLSELYERYGDKVDEIKEDMQKEYKEEKNFPAESTLVQVDYTSDGFISYSCDESLNDDLQSYIDKVPNGVLNAVQSIGYHINLVEDPGKGYGYSNVCGLTVPSEKIILIQAKESKFRRSVVHEIFHAFDNYLGFVSKSAEFYEIYEAEKESFIVTGFTSDSHYKSNVKEYFAEACQMYVYDSGILQSSAPRTFDFVKHYIEGVR